MRSRGAARPTPCAPRSVVRRTAEQGCVSHAAVPRMNAVAGDTKLTLTASVPGGTGPPGGSDALGGEVPPLVPVVPGACVDVETVNGVETVGVELEWARG